jgi:predicted GIY-YIG superfamily endonuclease
MFTVYVLRCSDGSLYVGQTDNLQDRLLRHERGNVRWTKGRLPVELVHREEFSTRTEALRREKALKTGYGRKWLKRKLG